MKSKEKPLRKIIFLDVDGVICSARCNKPKKDLTEEALAELEHDPKEKCNFLEKFNLDMLEDVIKKGSKEGKVNVEIVLSTSWRHLDYQRDFLTSVLEARGMKVVGNTPFLKLKNPGKMMWGGVKNATE